MNLWLRLIWLFMTSPWRPRIAMPDGVSALTLPVLPNDLDLSFHMNNGRYLAVMDLGRLDLLIRTGLGKAVWRHGWTPVANAAVIRFRRELRAFERYRLETRVVAWLDQAVLLEQTFILASGDREGQVAARALFKGALYDRKQRRYVPVAALMETLGLATTSPPLPAEFEAFLTADRTMKETDRAARENET